MINSSIHSNMCIHSRFFPFLANPYWSFPPPRLLTLCVSFDTLTINTSFPSSPASSTVNHVIKFLLTSIHSSMSNHSWFFPFFTNPYWSFPLSTQRSSFDTLTNNTTFPFSQSFLTVNPTIKSLLTFSSILPFILAFSPIHHSIWCW